MNILRMLLPSVMVAFGILLFLWFIGWQIILKNFIGTAEEKEQTRKVISRIYYIIVLISLTWLVFKGVNMASVNEIPRSVIDRTTPENMKENFEQRMKKAAEKAKYTNDSIKQLNKQN